MKFEPVDFSSAEVVQKRRGVDWTKLRWFDLQWAHRAGSVAFFALLASIAGALRGEGAYGMGLAASVIIADIGLIGGIFAWWTTRRISERSWEATGVIWFNLIILLIAAGLYAAGYFGYLTHMVTWITNHIPAAS